MKPTFPLCEGLLPISFAKIPFSVVRMFIVHSNKPGEVRGEHAHWDTQQLLVCSAGLIQFDVETVEGDERRVYLSPGESYYHGPLEWIKITYVTGGDTLLSFCSTEYFESDCIRDYERFKDIQRPTKEVINENI